MNNYPDYPMCKGFADYLCSNRVHDDGDHGLCLDCLKEQDDYKECAECGEWHAVETMRRNEMGELLCERHAPPRRYTDDDAYEAMRDRLSFPCL